MRTKPLFWMMAALASTPGALYAQAPLSPATPPAQIAPAGSTNCAPMDHGGMSPHGSTVGEAGEPLGQKLAKSNGVLCPPEGVDPEMRAPAPNKGNTPVIPPPGSPGGNPNMQPK